MYYRPVTTRAVFTKVISKIGLKDGTVITYEAEEYNPGKINNRGSHYCPHSPNSKFVARRDKNLVGMFLTTQKSARDSFGSQLLRVLDDLLDILAFVEYRVTIRLGARLWEDVDQFTCRKEELGIQVGRALYKWNRIAKERDVVVTHKWHELLNHDAKSLGTKLLQDKWTVVDRLDGVYYDGCPAVWLDPDGLRVVFDMCYNRPEGRYYVGSITAY